jgi:hypothetical protein
LVRDSFCRPLAGTGLTARYLSHRLQTVGFTAASWTKRPIPPSPQELAFSDCQDIAHFTPLVILVCSSVALRFLWLWRAHRYSLVWAAGRVFVDHVVLTFRAGIFIAFYLPNDAVNRMQRGLIATNCAASGRRGGGSIRL